MHVELQLIAWRLITRENTITNLGSRRSRRSSICVRSSSFRLQSMLLLSHPLFFLVFRVVPLYFKVKARVINKIHSKLMEH